MSGLDDPIKYTIQCVTSDDDIESCLDYESIKFKLEEIDKLIDIIIDNAKKIQNTIYNTSDYSTDDEVNKIKSLLEYKNKNRNILEKLRIKKEKFNCDIEHKIPVLNDNKSTDEELEQKTRNASHLIGNLSSSSNPKDNKLYEELETLYTNLKRVFEKYNNETDNKEKNRIYFQQIISKLARYETILEDIINHNHKDCLTFGGKKGRKTNKRRTKRNQKANKRTKKMKKSKTKKVKKMKKINRNKQSKKIKTGGGGCISTMSGIPEADCVYKIPTVDHNKVKLGMSTTVKKLIKSGIITEAEAEVFKREHSNVIVEIIQDNN